MKIRPVNIWDSTINKEHAFRMTITIMLSSDLQISEAYIRRWSRDNENPSAQYTLHNCKHQQTYTLPQPPDTSNRHVHPHLHDFSILPLPRPFTSQCCGVRLPFRLPTRVLHEFFLLMWYLHGSLHRRRTTILLFRPNSRQSIYLLP